VNNITTLWSFFLSKLSLLYTKSRNFISHYRYDASVAQNDAESHNNSACCHGSRLRWTHNHIVRIECVFHQNLKQASVRPRLKKSTLDPDDLNSYRPISNLTFLSKVVERAAAVRLRRHVESQRLLPDRQSAYRPHHSTETDIIAVHDKIVKTVDSGDVCAVVLLDLSAVSDTVVHLHILNKRVAFESVALDWCQSYLCQLSQSFCVNGHLAGPCNVDCSVHQGSVLGPLKFIGYTEDLAYLIHRHHLSYHL